MFDLSGLWATMNDPHVVALLALIWMGYQWNRARKAANLRDRAIAAGQKAIVSRDAEKASHGATLEVLEEMRAELRQAQERAAQVPSSQAQTREFRGVSSDDIALLQGLRREHPRGLEALIRNAQAIVESREDIQRLRVQCSLDMPLLATTEALSAYLDGLEANIAIVPGPDTDRPFQVAIRHKDGWVVLHDGFHDFNLLGGRVAGLMNTTVVPPHDGPIQVRRARFGAHVNRNMPA